MGSYVLGRQYVLGPTQALSQAGKKTARTVEWFLVLIGWLRYFHYSFLLAQSNGLKAEFSILARKLRHNARRNYHNTVLSCHKCLRQIPGNHLTLFHFVSFVICRLLLFNPLTFNGSLQLIFKNTENSVGCTVSLLVDRKCQTNKLFEAGFIYYWQNLYY